MSGSTRRVAAVLTTAGVSMALVLPSGPTMAQAPTSATDVQVLRVTKGARTIGHGGSLLLGIAVANNGSTATSTDRPLMLSFADLPTGVTLRAADDHQPGLSCDATGCQYTGPVAPNRMTLLHLVADVAASVRPGKVRFEVAADTPGDDPDTDSTDSVHFRVTDQKVRPTVSLSMFPRGGVAAGRPAVFAARLVTVAGNSTRMIDVADVVPEGLIARPRAHGAGWHCSGSDGLDCTYAPRLAVGQASVPLVVKGRVRSDPDYTKLLPGSSKQHGRQADVRWRSRIRPAGARPQTQTTSVVAQLRAPRWPQAKRPDPDVPDWTRLTHLESRLQSVGALRPGGSARLRLDTLYNGVGHTRGATRAQVTMPRGISIRRVQAPGWRCAIKTSGRGTDCSLPHRIKRGSHAARIILHVTAERSLPTRRPLRVTSTCTWRSRQGVHRDRDSTRIHVLSALRVKARVSDTSALASPRGNGPTSKRHVQLQAAISGADVRLRPAYRWKQVRGPRVQWIGPRSSAHGHDHVVATFRAPAVRRSTKVAFQVTAQLNGATATDRVGVRLRPSRVDVMKSHAAQSRKAARRAKPPGPVPDRGAWVGQRNRSAFKITMAGGRGEKVVTAGEPFRLRPRISGAQVSSFRWRILDGPKSVGRGSLRRPEFHGKAPRAAGLLLVGLRVKGRHGRHASRATVLRVLPRTDSQASRQSLATAASPFCSLFTQAQGGSVKQAISVQGGQGQLTIGPVSARGAACSSRNAALTFTNARVTLGAHAFTGVTGQLTANGLGITAGTYQPPDSWAEALSFLGDPSLSFTTGSGAIISPWSGQSLGSLSGSFTVAEFLFLDLPQGWSGSTQFTFTPGSKQPLALAATAKEAGGGGGSGVAALSGTAGWNGTFLLNASTANLVTFTGSGGSQATASGSGKVSLTSPGGTVQYDVTAALDGSLQLFESLTIDSATIRVDNTGVAVSAIAAIAADGQSVGVQLAGSYANSSSWSLTADQTGSWTSPDVTVSNLTGSLANDNGVLGFTVSGEASGIAAPAALTVSDLTAVVTNVCPPKSASCDAGAIRLAIDVTGEVSMEGIDEPYSGSLQVDLTTMSVSFSAQVADADFGPDGLQLSDITIGFDSQGNPIPNGTCSGTGLGSDALSFAATVDDVFGADDVPVIGEIGSDGYCFSADLDSFSPTGNPAIDSSFTGVALIYSSYATTLQVPGLSAPVAIPAETAGLFGTFATPASMTGPLGGLSGDAVFHAVLTDTGGDMGFNGGIDYSFTTPLYLTGGASADVSSLSVSDVELTVAAGGGDFDLTLQADGEYYTPGSADGSSQAESMPLTVGVDIDLTTASFGFVANAAGGVPVTDAFGQAGLTLDNLSIAGSLGATDSLAFAAEADLPESWVGSLGVAPDTEIGLVIDLSAKPCLQFTLGQPTQTTPAINFMNEGVLVADYANVVLAPLGCQFGTVDIAAGFALDFDGFIGDDRIMFNAALDLGGTGFALDADVFLAEFSLGSVELTDTTFALDLDPASQVFDVTFGSTVTIGDSSLTVSGSYDQNGDTTTASFDLDSPGQISIAGFEFDDATVAFTYSSSPPESSMTFTMSGYVAFLGQSFDGTVALTTQNGSVNSASGDFVIDIDVGIASISGPLVFTYQSGEGASGTFGPGDVSAVGIDFFDVTGSLQPDGSYTVQAYTAVPNQNASAADTWLYGNEGGEFNTVFAGRLGINVTGGAGEPAVVDYGGSSLAVWSEWSTHTWTSYGDWVSIPTPGCADTFVAGDGVLGTPDANFFLNPYAVENASTGDPDDDDDSCLQFTSQVVP